MVPPRCHVSTELKVSKPHSSTGQDPQVPTLISTQPFLLLPHPHIPITSGAEVTPEKLIYHLSRKKFKRIM